MSVTPFLRNTSCTAGSANALRSFTRQVRHQLAVKLTRSGVPLASSACTRAASYGCQLSSAEEAPAAAAAVAPPTGAAFATLARRAGSAIASSTAAAAVTIAAHRPAAEL